jgi:hypothetical protein
MHEVTRGAWVVAIALAVTTSCTSGDNRPESAADPTSPPNATSPVATPVPSPTVAARPVVVRYRVVRHTHDAATAGFASTVDATLHDPRGWQRGDVQLIRDARAPDTVVLAEPDEVQRLCEPYDVYGKYSCQNGPVVALNAERWRHATPEWTGSLAAYRQMLVNHEFGHLLGLHHPPAPQCPRRGSPAPVMAQQSTELKGCRPNPWPLAPEVQLLARHVLPLAPPAQ